MFIQAHEFVCWAIVLRTSSVKNNWKKKSVDFVRVLRVCWKFSKWFPGVWFVVKFESTLVLLSGSLYDKSLLVVSLLFIGFCFDLEALFDVDKEGDDPNPTGVEVANIDVKLFLLASTDTPDFSEYGYGETFEIFLSFLALVYVRLTVSLFLSTSLLVLRPLALLLALSCFWIGNISTTLSLGSSSSSVSLKKHIKWFQILQNYCQAVSTEI